MNFLCFKIVGIFCEAHEKGSLYWDSGRIMQNFQDVENSKKRVSNQDSLTNFQLEENICGNLTKKMKEHHIIHDPVSSEESSLIQKVSNVSGQSSTIEEYDHQHNIDSESSVVVKVVLNIDQSVAKNEPQWDELEKQILWITKHFH
jgi:hypothetical protein